MGASAEQDIARRNYLPAGGGVEEVLEALGAAAGLFFTIWPRLGSPESTGFPSAM